MDNRGLKEAIMKISRLTFIGFLISLFLASGAHTHDLLWPAEKLKARFPQAASFEQKNLYMSDEHKHGSKEEVVSSLAVMEEQAYKIDAVIAALRKVTEIRTADYTSEGHGLMIDVEKEILELIKEKNAIVG